MQDRGFDFVEAIEAHSAGVASAARGNLDAAVEHCPGWTVADLVAHLTEVQWFWATIVAERLSAPPDEARRPAVAPAEKLVASFEEGADRLAEVLRRADARDAVWTWAPAQRDVAFVARHQVQEAAVHHFDAALAAGRPVAIDPPVAVDSITEFLTFSVSSEADPADPARPALGGRFTLACADAESAWTVSDGSVEGTVTFEQRADEAAPTIAATASDILLWLYRRVGLDEAPVPAPVIERFRALCFTD